MTEPDTFAMPHRPPPATAFFIAFPDFARRLPPGRPSFFFFFTLMPLIDLIIEIFRLRC